MASPSQIRAGKAVVEVAIDPTYRAGLARIKGDFDTLGNRIDAIKQRFGSRGLLKDVTELAVGGGAVAGINFLAATLNRATAAAGELVGKFREGKVTAGEFGAEMAKSLPIIGELAGAVENVLDIITGWKSEAAKLTEEVEKANKKMAETARNAKAAGDYIEDAQNRADQFNADAARTRGDTATANRLEAGIAANRNQRQLEAAIEKQLPAVGPDNVDPVEKRLQALRDIATRNNGSRPVIPDAILGSDGPDSVPTVTNQAEINAAKEAQKRFDNEAAQTKEAEARLKRIDAIIAANAAALKAEAGKQLSESLKSFLQSLFGTKLVDIPIVDSPVPFLPGQDVAPGKRQGVPYLDAQNTDEEIRQAQKDAEYAARQAGAAAMAAASISSSGSFSTAAALGSLGGSGDPTAQLVNETKENGRALKKIADNTRKGARFT